MSRKLAMDDPLILLRSSIAASNPPSLTTSSDPSTAPSQLTGSFALATDLYFSKPVPQCIPLTTSTRFHSTTPDNAQVDLRSIFFAWVQKDVTVPEYIAKASELNTQLPKDQNVRNLVFVERIDLITWLEGASDESEYIKPREGAATGIGEAAGKAADVAGGVGVPTVSGTGVGVTHTAGGRAIKVIDARLQEIYNGERKMGDHNTVLRGIKPTVSLTMMGGSCPPVSVFLTATRILAMFGNMLLYSSTRGGRLSQALALVLANQTSLYRIVQRHLHRSRSPLLSHRNAPIRSYSYLPRLLHYFECPTSNPSLTWAFSSPRITQPSQHRQRQTSSTSPERSNHFPNDPFASSS